MPADDSPTWRERLRPHLLRAYRLGVIVAAVLLIRAHHDYLRVQGDRPISVDEVRELLPDAAALDADPSERAGLFVYDAAGAQIGYALRTLPQADDIIGYSGRTDALVVLYADGKVAGVRIRSSDDTVEHVQWVKDDDWHMSRWDGMTFEAVATMDLEESQVEGVSGATYTSMAMAHGIVQRFAMAHDAANAPPKPIRFTLSDIGIVVVIAAACGMMFTHLRGRKWVRRTFQVAMVGYLGFTLGDLLAWSLFAGWAKSGVAWRLAPGLVLLAAAALIIPWTTRRPIYCASICPHGIAQQWVGRWVPWRWRIPPKAEPALRWIPPLLIALVVFVTMLRLPFDLAGIEPFDAYLVAQAGWATIAVALVGLVFAAFVPMGYCKYGCPTGALLEFVRSHGKADKFGRRDLVAGLLVAFIALLAWQYPAINTLIRGA